MLKRTLTVLFTIIFMLTLFVPGAIAKEEANLQFFGVSADVQKNTQDNSYIVKTKGKQTKEGFVFSSTNVKGGQPLIINVDLKGKGEVFLKIQETNARGAFIKETNSFPVSLNGEWKSQQLSTTLDPSTSEVDIRVLTINKTKTQFSFKNVQLK